MMKKKQTYTFIIAENGNSHSKIFTVQKKHVHKLLGLLVFCLALFVIFLTDYFGQHVDQWKLVQLKKENQNISQKFVQLDKQLKD